MTSLIPSRDLETNERTFAKVHEDKTREAADGFDGAWVAHPGMVDLHRKVFTEVLHELQTQLEKTRPEVEITAVRLLDVASASGSVTVDG